MPRGWQLNPSAYASCGQWVIYYSNCEARFAFGLGVFVGAALELLTAVLVLVDGAQDGDDLGLGGQGDGTGNLGIGALGGLDDGLGGLVDELVVIGLQTDADHVLVGGACHVFASPFRTFFRRHWLRLSMRTDETPDFLYTQPCVSGRVRKTNRFFNRLSPVRAIYACTGKVSAARLRTGTGPIPDILHGSYLASGEQSPASSHSALFCTRSGSISAKRGTVKGFLLSF